MFAPFRHKDGLLDEDSSSRDEVKDIQSMQEGFEEEMKQEMEFHAASLTQSTAGPSSIAEKDREDENDELLYDPNADEEDKKWMENKRKEYLGLPLEKDPQLSASGNSNNVNTKKCPDSDAVLNCPGCMTVLCLDCQRHEVYKTQYRAMFVLNCTIDWSEKLTSKKDGCKKGNKNTRMRERMEATWESIESETDSFFFNVRCSVCNTQVAVYDEDEVFHFCNVLSSYS